MSDIIITPEITKFIEDIVNQTVQLSAKAVENRNKASKNEEINYFRETEKKLYNYKYLQKKIENDLDDIKDMETEYERNQRVGNYGTKSKDIVCVPNGGIRLDPDEKHQVLIAGKIANMDRTKTEVRKVERALDTIRKDKDYKIVEYKYGIAKDENGEYIEPMELDKIAEKINVSESTVKRHRRRLIDSLIIAFYGADALSS